MALSEGPAGAETNAEQNAHRDQQQQNHQARATGRLDIGGIGTTALS